MVRNAPPPGSSEFSLAPSWTPQVSFKGTPAVTLIQYSGTGRLVFKNKHTTWVSAYSPASDIDTGYIRFYSAIYLGYLSNRYPGFTFSRVVSSKKFNQGCFKLFSCRSYRITVSGTTPPPPDRKYVAKSMFLDWDNHPANLVGVTYNEFYRCDHGRRKAKEYLIDLAAKALTPTLTAIYGKDIFDSTEQVENAMKEKKEKEEGHEM
jgi:hypothetical protein